MLLRGTQWQTPFLCSRWFFLSNHLQTEILCASFVCPNSDCSTGLIGGMFSVWPAVAVPDASQGPETLPSGIWGLFYFKGLHLTLTVKFADFTLERLGAHKPSSHELCHVQRWCTQAILPWSMSCAKVSHLKICAPGKHPVLGNQVRKSSLLCPHYNHTERHKPISFVMYWAFQLLLRHMTSCSLAFSEDTKQKCFLREKMFVSKAPISFYGYYFIIS